MATTWPNVVHWVARQANRYGGVVSDCETGRTMDWGQAIAREAFGPQWWNSPEWYAADCAPEPPSAIVDAMISLSDRGNPRWPSWARINGGGDG